ncbi:acetylxylan esterase [Planctomonas psychrotolerans]|uniref:acetylxylan esterase n=1 Tax=Planctomonas psychrotolerans TaxID=2528712 RepID=UPI0012395FA4|nr:acetylxylan esterase [Planctomonas psychrotolerans]
MFTDMSETDLWNYRSSVPNPDDFDTFWDSTLAEAAEHDLDVQVEPYESGLATVTVWDVTFSGFGGDRIKAWLLLPAAASGPLPVVVEYVGYGGGRGNPLESLLWSSAGYAHLLMDSRGQGAAHHRGSTPDTGATGPAFPGVMTRGIERPEDYYYRRLFTDAVRAVDAAKALPQVDPERVAIVGGSQGGAMVLAVAGLRSDLSAAVAYVPFLSDIRRATEITDNMPYREIASYLAVQRDRVEQVFTTLAYFDGVNFARRATVPVWYSAALMDPVCPPSTVFASFSEYAGPKQITVWPYNAHEGGAIEDAVIAMEAIGGVFASSGEDTKVS